VFIVSGFDYLPLFLLFAQLFGFFILFSFLFFAVYSAFLSLFLRERESCLPAIKKLSLYFPGAI